MHPSPRSALLPLLCLAVVLAGGVDAGERQRAGGFSTGRGHSGTFTQQTSRAEDGSLSHQVQVTGANGETAERSTRYSLDRDSGTLSRSVTGPQGNTRTGSVTLTPNP